MKEHASLFGTFGTLVGITTEPEDVLNWQTRPAVILLNAGMIHRVGPNRIYVKLARRLSEQGYLTLRMDLSGIGDSLPRPDHMSIEKSAIDDTIQAMDYLEETYQCQRFVLMGHCAGAFLSFFAASQDERVTGIGLINLEGGDENWTEYDRRRKLATYQQNVYSKTKIRNPENWKRLFTGKVKYKNVFQTLFRDIIWFRVTNLFFRLKIKSGHKPQIEEDPASYSVESIVRKMGDIPACSLLTYYEGSSSLQRVQMMVGKELSELTETDKVELKIIPQADHLYTLIKSQQILISGILEWIMSIPEI